MLISLYEFGDMISFFDKILNTGSFVSSKFISTGAFPPLNNFNFCITVISTFSWSILSYLNTNLFRVLITSNFAMIISAHTFKLNTCL